MKYLKTLTFIIFANSLFAQNNNQLKLYAVVGSQINSISPNFNTTLNGSFNSLTMGAGSSYYFSNLFLGTEFYYLNGKKSNQDYKLAFSGMNSTLSFGYSLLSNKFQLEPQIGFQLSSNRMIKDDIQSHKTEYFNKNNLGLTPAISFNYRNQAGIIYGIKTGYNFSINKNNNWENGIDNSKSIFSANTNSIFVQLNLGGIIDLKKKKNKFDEVELTDMKTNNIKIKTDIIDNNGDKLYSTIYQNPSKETIILLHGGPGFPSDLKEVVDILKDNFQIINFHQRGTKKSPCISNDYSMNAYLSDIECVSKFYNITKFHLWGHSWGGLYAQIYAEKYPDNLLSLFLCCPGSGTNIEWKQTEKEVMQLNKSKCTTWQWTKMGMNNLLGMLGSHNAYKRLFKQVMKNYNDDFVNSENLGIDFNNLKANPINKTRPEIVKHPTLTKQENPKYEITIVYGDKDIYQSSKNFVINRYPTAKVFTIKNCGHIPWLHNPTEYFQIMKNHYE